MGADKDHLFSFMVQLKVIVWFVFMAWEEISLGVLLINFDVLLL